MLLKLQFLLRVVERLLGKGERLFIYLRPFIGVNQIPIHVCDLRHGFNHLGFESNVGNLFVILGDAQVAQVGAEAKPSEQFLAKLD